MTSAYIADTSVLSEPMRTQPDERVVRWLKDHKDALWVSVMSLGELRFGVENVRPKDPTRAARLELRLDGVRSQYDDRVVRVDADVADEWGRLQLANPGHSVDNILAATALVNGWMVATRNVEDFERTGVRAVNPWEYDG